MPETGEARLNAFRRAACAKQSTCDRLGAQLRFVTQGDGQYIVSSAKPGSKVFAKEVR